MTHQEKESAKKIKKIYGNGLVSVTGTTMSERKLNYLIDKIKRIPVVYVDIRNIKMKREKIESICNTYSFIKIVDDKIRHV